MTQMVVSKWVIVFQDYQRSVIVNCCTKSNKYDPEIDSSFDMLRVIVTFAVILEPPILSFIFLPVEEMGTKNAAALKQEQTN